MANVIEVKVPDIGDYKGVPVIELLVKEGDTVAKDQALVVLESDKSTMEVPSPSAGVVRGLKVQLGDKLSQGDLICGLESEGAGAAAAAATPPPAASAGGDGSQRGTDSMSVPRKPVGEGGAAGGEKSTPAKGQKAPTADLFSAPAPAASAPTQPSPVHGGGLVAVTVPDIGDFHDIPVIELLVKAGDTVSKDQALVVLESEKSTMEVPSPGAGTVKSVSVKVGDKVSKGAALLELETAGGNGQPAKPAAASPLPQGEAAAKAAGEGASAPPQKGPSLTPAPPPAGEDRKAVEVPASTGANSHAGPATRKFGRELGVDLAKVQGSGPKGRVLIEDVQKFVKQQMTAPPPPAAAAPMTGSGIPPIPAQDFSLYGEIENKPLARIRKISATYLHRAWVNIPHVTQTDEADITELEAFRKSFNDEGGAKLTLLPFIMKAVSVAMRQYPEFGSSLSPDGASLIMKKYCHIGFAADTPNGLVVPVVRDVWSKSLTQLAVETGELAKKARDGKLKPDEMKGGCFSISSLGGIGGSHFTPIVNAPEVGILGVSRGVMKPVWDGKAFQPRLMVPLSLSYDHRVIDGAYAARFIVALCKLLADLRRLSL